MSNYYSNRQFTFVAKDFVAIKALCQLLKPRYCLAVIVDEGVVNGVLCFHNVKSMASLHNHHPELKFAPLREVVIDEIRRLLDGVTESQIWSHGNVKDKRRDMLNKQYMCTACTQLMKKRKAEESPDETL